MRLVVLMFITLSITSCLSESEKRIKGIERVLIGTWSIDYMVDKDQESVLLLQNLITFSRNGDFSSYHFKNAKWKVEQSSNDSYQLKLNSNESLNNIYFDLKFIKDQNNKLLKLKLSSSEFKLLCRKALYNFDLNINRINYLVEITK